MEDNRPVIEMQPLCWVIDYMTCWPKASLLGHLAHELNLRLFCPSGAFFWTDVPGIKIDACIFPTLYVCASVVIGLCCPQMVLLSLLLPAMMSCFPPGNVFWNLVFWQRQHKHISDCWNDKMCWTFIFYVWAATTCCKWSKNSKTKNVLQKLCRKARKKHWHHNYAT